MYVQFSCEEKVRNGITVEDRSESPHLSTEQVNKALITTQLTLHSEFPSIYAQDLQTEFLLTKIYQLFYKI